MKNRLKWFFRQLGWLAGTEEARNATFSWSFRIGERRMRFDLQVHVFRGPFA